MPKPLPPTQLQPSVGSAVAPIGELLHRASEYARNSKATSTLRAYDSAWRSFAAWCRARDVTALPAVPTTVVAFVADLAVRLRPTTITRNVIAVSQAHQLVNLPDPTLDPAVKAVMRGLRRTHGRPAVGKAPLLVGDLISIVRSLDVSTMQGLRDRAMLLLGFAAAMRRSEIVDLDVGDLEFVPAGLALTIRRSKRDQEGRGRSIGISYGENGTCPVIAARSWIALAGINAGPLFRAVDRHDSVLAHRLNGRTVCRVVKKLVPLAALEPARFGGHSLRSGFATSAAAAGIDEREIALVTGHASLLVLRRYIRAGTLFDADIVKRVGL